MVRKPASRGFAGPTRAAEIAWWRASAARAWEVPVPAASMFAWAPIPEPYREIGSVAFAKLLVEEADVAVSPGLGFG